MRRALVDRMAKELLTEFLGVFERIPPSPARRSEVLGRLFRALAVVERHAQLFAWLALEASDDNESDAVTWAGAPLFDALFDRIAAQEDATGHDREAARFGVLLAVTSAIGFGIASPWLKHAGLVTDANAIERFAARFAEFLGARRLPSRPHLQFGKDLTERGPERYLSWLFFERAFKVVVHDV